MELSIYSFIFEDIPRSSNILADCFSRSTLEKNNIEILTLDPDLILDQYQALPILESDIQDMTKFGRPSIISYDLVLKFTSHVYNIFNNILGIKNCFTPA